MTDMTTPKGPKFPVEPPKPSKGLNFIGFIASGIWLLVIFGYALLQHEKFLDLEPNEMGDFMAGAFAPLAFLWLVLGFFQQGVELRNSGNALWLQGVELQNSVEQQRELVEVTREQLAFEARMLEEQRDEMARNSRPILHMSVEGVGVEQNGKRPFRFRLMNHGKPCTDVRVIGINGHQVHSSARLETAGKVEFSLLMLSDQVIQFSLEVTYVDERLMPGSAVFHVQKNTTEITVGAARPGDTLVTTT